MFIRRCLVGLVLVFAGAAKAEIITFPSGTNLPGTIEDKNGLGTGLTVRLPGTGGALPEHDPNLDLLANPGFLTITSTPDWRGNPVYNPGIAEALGLFVPNPGTNDIRIEAWFRDVHIGDWSDQLGVFAKPSNTADLLRAGLHMQLQWQYGPPGLRQYYLGSEYADEFVTPAPYPPPGTPPLYENGDDINITLSRVGGKWGLSWKNLTKGTLGTSGNTYQFDWLDNQDLYVGIYYVNPRNWVSNTSRVERFEVSSVPEPSTLIIWSLLGASGVGIGWWRRRPKA